MFDKYSLDSENLKSFVGSRDGFEINDGSHDSY